MILPIYVISVYCNIKHLFETWKYLYKSGSPDDKCIDSHPHRLQGQKVKSHVAGAYCVGHLAAQLVIFVLWCLFHSVIWATFVWFRQAIHYVMYPCWQSLPFFLLNKDGSCPTADLSNIGRPSGPAYSTGELLNMPLVSGLEHSPKNQRLGLSYICLCTMAGTFVYRFHENSLPS